MDQSRSLVLSDYDISPERGFLPKDDPLISLPKELDFLDEIGNNLPELIGSRSLNSQVIQLPIPPARFFHSLGPQELQLAWQRYTFIMSAHVHTQEPPASICLNIARPVWEISKMLAKPPILSYDAYTLYNWQRKDKSGPIKVDSLALVQTFMRDPIQSWFILIHVDIEAEAGLAIRNIREAVLAAEREDDVALESALLDIDVSLRNILAVMHRMTENTSPETYYKIRRWIMSFKNVVYEGVDELEGKPQTFNGQTGAQTSIFQTLEAGLQAPPLEINELAVFLKKMREYMPVGHTRFIQELETRSQVRKFIAHSAPKLIEPYNSCIDKVCSFLDTHLKYAIAYIHNRTTNPEGTGGSEFMKYLGERLKERRENAFIKLKIPKTA